MKYKNSVLHTGRSPFREGEFGAPRESARVLPASGQVIERLELEGVQQKQCKALNQTVSMYGI